ncbi:DUF551 domain-containing protein [Sinorhizobium meliloti]|nr:DUF551 domain-containing protein [Sinorhizobium meliloti]
MRSRAEEIAGNNRPVSWPEVLLLVGTAIAGERAWQPIETAPKDWTDVLLFVPNLDSDWRNVCEGYYDAENEVWENPMFGAVDPTHWQPLPTPPETEREAME